MKTNIIIPTTLVRLKTNGKVYWTGTWKQYVNSVCFAEECLAKIGLEKHGNFENFHHVTVELVKEEEEKTITSKNKIDYQNIIWLDGRRWIVDFEKMELRKCYNETNKITITSDEIYLFEQAVRSNLPVNLTMGTNRFRISLFDFADTIEELKTK